MANDITKNPIYITDVGVVMTTPLWIKKIVLVPAADGDRAVLKYWIENPSGERVHKQNKTASASGAHTLTSTGNFDTTADPVEAIVGDAIHIYASSSGNNLGVYEITSVDDTPDTVDVYPTLTIESDKIYSWKIYESYPLASMKSQNAAGAGNLLLNYELNFKGDGLYTRNLMLTQISDDAVLYIYFDA